MRIDARVTNELPHGQVACACARFAACRSGVEHAALGCIGLISTGVTKLRGSGVGQHARTFKLTGVTAVLDQWANTALLLDEDHRGAPCVDQVWYQTSTRRLRLTARAELPGSLTEFTTLGRIEGVILLAVLERTFTHLVGINPNLERRSDAAEGEFRAAEGVVVRIGGNAVAAHECKQRILSRGDLRKVTVAIQSGVQGLVRNCGWILIELLEVRVAGLCKLLRRSHGGRGFGALNHLAERGKEQTNEQSNDANHHQQFHQGEASKGGSGAADWTA